jgi:hypothetical protein
MEKLYKIQEGLLRQNQLDHSQKSVSNAIVVQTQTRYEHSLV